MSTAPTSRPRARVGLGLAALFCVFAGCGAADTDPTPAAPVSPRFGAVIEPPELRIGDVAVVEVAIVVPPSHRVEPISAPDRVPGLWILEAQELPVERTAAHHVHRTQFKVRARKTGEFAWPAQTAIVETPTGERLELVSAHRPLVIHEVTGEFPGRREPFSFRAPGSKTRDGGFALPALLGAGGMLLALLFAGWVRRVRNRPPPVRSAALAVPSSRATQAALEAALDRLADDPVGAANAASAALRVHAAQRYASSAKTATTEELIGTDAPPGARKRWPEFLRLLRALDGFRFRAVAEDRLERDELSATLRDAQRFVGESDPRLAQ